MKAHLQLLQGFEPCRPVLRGGESPHKDGALIVGDSEQAGVVSDTHAADGLCAIGDKLRAACILSQVPHSDVAVAVSRNQFALVGVERDAVDGTPALKFTRTSRCPYVPLPREGEQRDEKARPCCPCGLCIRQWAARLWLQYAQS